MSVLIKGMEMPTSCGFCMFEQDYGDGCECYINGCLTEYQKRPDDCPLVPVPKHGRLIDADALERDFREDAEDAWNKEASPISWADAFSELADMVADAPTIIETEGGE